MLSPSAPKAWLIGAKTVKGPGPESVWTSPPATTASTRVWSSGSAWAVSTTKERKRIEKETKKKLESC